MPIDWDNLQTGGAYRGALAQSLLPSRGPLPGLQPGQRIGPFAIVRELARGGMAVVYLAERDDGEFTQRVAVKWMPPASDEPVLEKMFRRERDILASLEHPGIARLLDGGRTADGMLWFAMELVEGEAIDAWCDSQRSSRVVRIQLIVELCAALGFAHGRLLVHRDIKPANVLVASDGRVRLLDFGIARLTDQHDLLGNFALTPGFASPEQLRGDPVTVASDIYQTGLLLARLVMPWPLAQPGMHATTALAAGSTGPIAIPDAMLKQLPAPLAAIVRRATALEAADRYASIDALGDDLARFISNRMVNTYQGGPAYSLRCFIRRQPLAAAASAVAVLALAAVAAVATLGRVEAERAGAEALRAERTAEATTDFLVSIFRAPDPQNNPGLALTARELLERGMAGIERLADEPVVQVRLLDAFGQVTWALGDYTRSSSLIERAIALHGKAAIDDPQALAGLYDRLGGLQRDQAAFESAEQHYLRAIAVLSEAGLGESKAAAAVYNNLGITLRRLNRLDDAASAYEQVLTILQREGQAPGHQLLSNLGTVELSRNRYEAARQRFLEATAALPADLPRNHPARAVVHSNLALAARQLGRLGEAIAHSEAAVAIEREALGATHPDRAETLQGLASSQLRLGRFSDANANLADGLGALRASVGAQHPRSLPLLLGLAHTAVIGNNAASAQATFAQIDAVIATLPEAQAARPRLALTRSRAALARRNGQLALAEQRSTQAQAQAQSLKLDGFAAQALLSQALAVVAQGRLAEAQVLWAQANATAACAAAHCVLDQADSLLIRAQWWAARGDLDQAFMALDAAIANPQWTAWLLELDGLQVMHGDPRWALAQAGLAVRIAADGAAVSVAR